MAFLICYYWENSMHKPFLDTRLGQALVIAGGIVALYFASFVPAMFDNHFVPGLGPF